MYKTDYSLPAHAHIKLAHSQPATQCNLSPLTWGLLGSLLASTCPYPLSNSNQRVHGLPCLKSSVHFCITLEYIPCFLSKPSNLSGTKFCFCVTHCTCSSVYSAHPLTLVCLLPGYVLPKLDTIFQNRTIIFSSLGNVKFAMTSFLASTKMDGKLPSAQITASATLFYPQRQIVPSSCRPK